MMNRKTHYRLAILASLLLAIIGSASITTQVYAELPPRPTRPPVETVPQNDIENDIIPDDSTVPSDEANDVEDDKIPDDSTVPSDEVNDLNTENVTTDNIANNPVDAIEEKLTIQPKPKKEVMPQPKPAGTILLQTASVTNGQRSVVQWQDAVGDWHDVDGWRGDIYGGQTVWWVEEQHWGSGPFRWLIYDGVHSTVTATSESFMLPNSGETLVVVVGL